MIIKTRKVEMIFVYMAFLLSHSQNLLLACLFVLYLVILVFGWLTSMSVNVLLEVILSRFVGLPFSHSFAILKMVSTLSMGRFRVINNNFIMKK